MLQIMKTRLEVLRTHGEDIANISRKLYFCKCQKCLAPHLNVVSRILKSNSIHWTKARGPRLMANFNDREDEVVCRHAELPEWRMYASYRIK